MHSNHKQTNSKQNLTTLNRLCVDVNNLNHVIKEAEWVTNVWCNDTQAWEVHDQDLRME